MLATLPSILDWKLAPTPSDRLTSCGKLTHITEYTNSTIQVMKFFCHRWDCPTCKAASIERTASKIMKFSPIWYTKTVGIDEFSAMQKRIQRSDAIYCGVGVEKILLLTNRPILPDMELKHGGKLKELISAYLDQPSGYRERRFRHSNNLFPKKEPSTVHIKRRITVKETVLNVVGKLKSNGYVSSNILPGVHYLQPPLFSARDVLSETLIGLSDDVVWIESECLETA
jgi:hypothetical protein